MKCLADAHKAAGLGLTLELQEIHHHPGVLRVITPSSLRSTYRRGVSGGDLTDRLAPFTFTVVMQETSRRGRRQVASIVGTLGEPEKAAEAA